MIVMIVSIVFEDAGREEVRVVTMRREMRVGRIPAGKRIMTIMTMPSPLHTPGTTLPGALRGKFPRQPKRRPPPELRRGTAFAVHKIAHLFVKLVRD